MSDETKMDSPAFRPGKLRYLRVVVGILLLLAKLAQFATTGPMELLPGSPAYHFGAYIGDSIMFALSAWLIYSGLRIARAR